MHFRDGMWNTAPGMRVEYAEQVYRVTQSPATKTVELLCPTKVIRSRGDTLNTPTISISLESVSDGIVAVEASHWQGARRLGPNFDLFPDGRPHSADTMLTDSATHACVTAGSLTATVTKGTGSFQIDFESNNKPLTSLSHRSIGFAYSPAPASPLELSDMRDKKHYMFAQLNLGVGEQVYGLGERFGAFGKVGQSVTLWNADGGTSSEQAYKNISFWLTNKGYGVFVDTPGKVELEIGSERSVRTQMSVEGQRLKWYIIHGSSPKEIISRYTALTGRPSRVPAWSFGLWLSTSFTTDYDENTVMSFVKGMQDRQIPLQVFHFDCFWLREFQWCDFEPDADFFPDMSGQITRMKESRAASKVCVWINSYIGQASPVFAEAAANGYLLKRRNGDIFQWDLWQTGMGIVDFTNPAACEWFTSCLNKLFDLGVDAIKTDFGERIPSDDVQWFDTTVDPERMHNYYTFLYNKVVYRALEARYGAGEAVLFARSACAGSQRFPVHWGGDCESTFEAMAESLRGALSLGVCGFSFWSVDIGGFEGRPNAAIYKRWVQFGLLCSHSRLHGSNSYRVPWLIDDDDRSEQGASAVLRKFSRLKCRLMPYIFSEAMEAINHGWPVSVRAMFLEFPADRTAWTCDQQFMLGSRLLVAPIFDESGQVEFYLPEGRWTSFWDQQTVIEGPKWVRETHDFGTLPLYVRENTVLVMGKEGEDRTVYDWTDASQREVQCYGAESDAYAVLYGPSGDYFGEVRSN